jgi:hypothetical protein
MHLDLTGESNYNLTGTLPTTIANLMAIGQRDKMRQLYARFSGNKSKCVKAYAEAEMRGEVRRDSNEYNISAERYAFRLFDEGILRNWLDSK